MNVKEIEAALEEQIDGDWGIWEDLGYFREHNEDPNLGVVEGLGRGEYVDSYGGEGQGDERWVVIRFGDRYFRKDGYYASYDGTTWDGDFREVKPTQKTITVYE